MKKEDSEDSVYEAICQKKRDRDAELAAFISDAHASIDSLTPKTIDTTLNWIKDCIIRGNKNPNNIQVNIELVSVDICSHVNQPCEFFLPLWKIVNVAKSNGYTFEIREMIHRYCCMLIDTWNAKHPKVQLDWAEDKKCEIIYIVNKK